MKTSVALKTLMKHVPRKDVGICTNFVLVSERGSDVLRKGILGWYKRTGDISAPVEGSFEGYLGNKRKWDKRTKFGKRRYELLNHLIKFYEERGD